MKKTLLALLLTLSPLYSQNAIILGDATTHGGDSDGGVLVQGSWLGESYSVNQHSIDNFALYIGNGNHTTNFLKAQHGISHISGGVGNFEGTIVHIPLLDFTPYEEIPDAYSALSGIPVDLSASNNVRITLDKEINVFDVNANQFSSLKTLDFTGTGKVIFNVTGNLVDWGWSVNYPADQVVFNFEDATIVNINSRQFTGAILAPLATVTQSQNLNGYLLANNWVVNGSTELHYYPLAQIPEPTVSILAILGGFIALCRKR